MTGKRPKRLATLIIVFSHKACEFMHSEQSLAGHGYLLTARWPFTLRTSKPKWL